MVPDEPSIRFRLGGIASFSLRISGEKTRSSMAVDVVIARLDGRDLRVVG